MLAAPTAVVPVTRIVLVPAVRGTEMDAVAQVSQLAVIGKFSVPCEVPLDPMEGLHLLEGLTGADLALLGSLLVPAR